MKRYYVELDTTTGRLIVYVMAYCAEHVKDMFSRDYLVICADETD